MVVFVNINKFIWVNRSIYLLTTITLYKLKSKPTQSHRYIQHFPSQYSNNATTLNPTIGQTETRPYLDLNPALTKTLQQYHICLCWTGPHETTLKTNQLIILHSLRHSLRCLKSLEPFLHWVKVQTVVISFEAANRVNKEENIWVTFIAIIVYLS